MGASWACRRRESETIERSPEGEPQRKRQRSSVVALNVGGVHYSTSRESLMKCHYFQVLLGGDFAEPSDEVFVDRDGELFQHLLKFMRIGRRPSESTMRKHRRELLAEAEFFGFVAFQRVLEGSTDPSQLLPRDRRMLEDEEECACFFSSPCLSELELRSLESNLLKPVFAESSSLVAREATELQIPLLRPHHGPAAPPRLEASDTADFRRRLSDLMERKVESSSSSDEADATRRARGNLLEDLEEIGGLVIAGGIVLAALTGGEASDVDLFCVGGDEAGAEARLQQVLMAVKRNHRVYNPSDARGSMKVARTMHAVTVDRGGDGPPLQIMLALYRSPLEVIISFDIDVCAFLYDVSRKEVLCLPRARRALAHRANVANTSMRSPSYEHRLEKYAKRGYAIGVPGLEQEALDPALRRGSYLFLEEVDLLLELGERTHETKEVCSQFTWTGTQLLSGQQQAVRVARGLRRLVALDLLREGLAHDASPCLRRDSARGSQDGPDEHIARSNSPLLVSHGDVDHPSGQLQLLSALEYKRFNADGSLEEVSPSDAQSAIWCIRRLANLANHLRPMGEAWAQDLGDQPIPERVQERWTLGEQWRRWAQSRRLHGRAIWFVCGKTKWATDDLSDEALAPLFDAGPVLEERPRVPREIPRRLRFERADACTAAFFGRHGHARYHRAHGDWFADIYA
mmetsp:Transcript_8789/g.27167  ORF Transcript_8789/g.27167 Transcript_8789/m.27167 type:complete len:688 (+) Transcript_8789:111-2174(+)